ncbi:glycosyl hydrolase [Histomonas meleagridis]|uniref:glycosyl hydrolase n=1 Tax=Histomonas meleagridis TaxID=135588 RepID=UPI00355ABD03|nr:glycosyl hydrolase [Histomonas meleagridis]KAH0805585.1 glycosyl hydrolase [Histomonas meleagridis]
MQSKIEQLLQELTLEEKATLIVGSDLWNTAPIPRLEISSVKISDGPHGLRCEANDRTVYPSTCFPTSSALGACFNEDLIRKMGEALGEECQHYGVSLLLGPAINMKRSPLCGRSFEYFTEDPYLCGKLGISYVEGLQSQGVGACVKHYACNNSEGNRMHGDMIVDERALYEIYLPAFEMIVKHAHPWSIMCSYNSLNGEFLAENKRMLTDILKNEFGFDGFIVSDWSAVHNRSKSCAAGLDLEMPKPEIDSIKMVIDDVKNGLLQIESVDNCVKRVLEFVLKANSQKKNITFDQNAHHQLSREVAEECIVLLKNEGNLLPLKRNSKISIIGQEAKNVRAQGWGSSRVKCSITPKTAYESIEEFIEQIQYSKGYKLLRDENDENYLDEAIEAAQNSDVTIIFVGVPDKSERESKDRKTMSLSDEQNELINTICNYQENVIVVVYAGSPVEMPWVNKPKSIVFPYYCGQAGSEALAKILFGEVNPSGKIAETFPLRMEDNPSFLDFGERNQTIYHESIFIGYRYYDMKKMNVLFPFGFGLSYTSFEYSNLNLSVGKKTFDNKKIIVKFEIKNVGECFGKEVAQMYIEGPRRGLNRPIKELKGFKKISLEPGEKKMVEMSLDKRSFALYYPKYKKFLSVTGNYKVLIGKSSREIVLEKKLIVISSDRNEYKELA